MESRPYGMIAETAFERVLHFQAPAVDCGVRRAWFVAQVVAVSHKCVDRAHGFALLPAQQQKRIIEVFGALAGDLAAVIVRIVNRAGHAPRRKAARANAASSRPARSIFDIAGRAASTL